MLCIYIPILTFALILLLPYTSYFLLQNELFFPPSGRKSVKTLPVGTHKGFTDEENSIIVGVVDGRNPGHGTGARDDAEH